MPFIALRDSDVVTPEEVNDDEVLECVDCGDAVKPRNSHVRDGSFVARHFWHPSGNTGGCEGGGESREHQRMKSIAASKARNRWKAATVNLEQKIGDRRADIIVSFPDVNERFGEGIAIEVQHKHESKNIEKVESEYIENQHSVLWLTKSQYSEKNVNLDGGKWSRWWPKQVPDLPDWPTDVGDLDLYDWWILRSRDRPYPHTTESADVGERSLMDISPYKRANFAFGVSGEFSSPEIAIEFPPKWFKNELRELYWRGKEEFESEKKSGCNEPRISNRNSWSEKYSGGRTCPDCGKNRVVSKTEAKLVFNYSTSSEYLCSYCHIHGTTDPI